MHGELRKLVTLRHAILARLGLLVGGTVLVLAVAYAIFGIRPLAEQAAESQFNASSSQVELALNRVFTPAAPLLEMSRRWIGNGAPDTDSPEAFNALFRPILESLPQFTSVVAGTSQGHGWMLLQLPNGHWRNRMSDLPRWGNRHQIWDEVPVSVDTSTGKSSGESTGESISESHWETLDYDARLRPWFENTQNQAGHIVWTAPYKLFTTGDPGITASTRWQFDDGMDFVLGFDLMLRDLSKATMGIKVGQHGQALVLTSDRRVLALPAPGAGVDLENWLKRVLVPATQLGLRQLSDAMTSGWPGEEFQPEVIRFRSDGTNWLGRAQPYTLGQQRLWVIVLAPESDFYPSLSPLVTVITLAMLLVLAITLLVARFDVKRFAQPLEKLASQSARMGHLDFQEAAPVQSPIKEIQQLASAQETTRSMLQQYQAKVEEQASGLLEQIAALSEAEARVRASEAYTKVLFSDSRIPMGVMDPETQTFVDCNQAAVDIYGVRNRDALLGRSPLEFSAPNQYDGRPSEDAAPEYIAQAQATGNQVFEWRHRRPDGHEWDAEVHLMAFKYGDQTLLQFSLQDISERKRAEEKLERLAFFDPLTGLANRALFMDRLNQAILAGERNGGTVAVMFLDLDRFKEINDTLGHAVGDLVLVEVAHRFQAVLRQEESLARVGGDEFIVMATGVDQNAATRIAERIRLALALPIELMDRQFSLRVSIGIAVYPSDGSTPDELFKHADVAMYRAKAYGSGYRFYEPDMSAGMADRMALANDLQQAMRGELGKLMLYFQPQIKLSSGELVGAEALLRWDHPSQGLVGPGVFIPIAEERGMMRELGEWVLREACRHMAAWRGAGLHWPGRLAINIAAQQIEDMEFPAMARSLVEEAGLRVDQFELELTESGLMRNVGQALALMGSLKAMGFALAIDDFGTGYSSLAYLKQLPADKIKIDISFVRDMMEDRNDRAIVATIVGMGKNMHLKTIAEGVETQGQTEILLAWGCDEAQGYHFGKPVPSEEFARTWLKPSPSE